MWRKASTAIVFVGLMESAGGVANPEITVLEALTDGLLVIRSQYGLSWRLGLLSKNSSQQHSPGDIRFKNASLATPRF
jgi:hypothetical protein